MARPCIIVLFSLLLLAGPGSGRSQGGNQPFAWNQDKLWFQLEQRFVEARGQDCRPLLPEIQRQLDDFADLIQTIEGQLLPPTAALWDEAEHRMLSLGPLLAACPDRLSVYVAAVNRLRRAVKRQSRKWPARDAATRQRLYRVIYGGRTAIEEILLQAPDTQVPALWQEEASPSAAPSTVIQGVTLYSGDMLVSRGGAATSALIARGSDYPGNFSHVSLLYVDTVTGKASVIESLIETGVQIHTMEEYLHDKKFRIMVLRLRPDLSPATQPPAVAHLAAKWAFEAASQQRIDYDFEMDYQNHDTLFCAEVLYAAYQNMGVTLWTGLSHISAAGTAQWLEGLGVRNFITLEPSDLEYDPQLIRVAEWRNPATLLNDHVYSAVTDAMLEDANAGNPMGYNRLMLPLAWGVKAYSAVKNRFGSTGPIPKGMGAKAALRSKWYTKQHALRVERVLEAVDAFKRDKGYTPPYWELVQMARLSK